MPKTPDIIPNMLKRIFVETEDTYADRHSTFVYSFMNVILACDMPGNLLAGTKFTSAYVNFDKGIIEFYEDMGSGKAENVHKFLMTMILVSG